MIDDQSSASRPFFIAMKVMPLLSSMILGTIGTLTGLSMITWMRSKVWKQ
jgi:hypothetical protein